MNITSSFDYLIEHIEAVFELGKIANGECTALTFSEPLAKRTLYIEKLMKELGMSTSYDPVANLVGILPGQEDRPRMMITSHVDSVVNAGRYDGVLGVLLGLAYVKYLRDEGITPRHPVEVRVCMGEESPGLTAMFGSRVSAGAFTYDDLKDMRLPWDKEVTVPEAIERFFRDYMEIDPPGLSPESLQDCRLNAGAYSSALEVHIEQFTLLKDLAETTDGKPWVGVMTGIGGHIRVEITLQGLDPEDKHTFTDGISAVFTAAGGHSGATPMGKGRDDALVKAVHGLDLLKDGLVSGHAGAKDIIIHHPSTTSIPHRVELVISCAAHDKAMIMQKLQDAGAQDVSDIEVDAARGSLHPALIEALVRCVLTAQDAHSHTDPAYEVRCTVTKCSRTEEGAIELYCDIRGADEGAMQKALDLIISRPKEQGVDADHVILSRKKPLLFKETMLNTAADRLSEAFDGRVMTGRVCVPGQDIGIIAECGIPSLLLFIESGLGHFPGEAVRPEALKQSFEAVRCLMNTLDQQGTDSCQEQGGRP